MQLNFREYGAGVPVIILHGLFGSLENWAYISGQLAEQFHIFAVDQRNHGSSPHSDEMNYDVLANDIRDFMQQQNLRSAAVLGHSMGGKAAMRFALLHPDLVDRLIIADMAPRTYPGTHHEIFEALLALDLSQFENRGQVEQALEPKIPELGIRRFLLKGLTRDADGSLRWKFNLYALHENYSALNCELESDQKFGKPALFLRGEKSNYIRDEDFPAVRELFPRAEVVTVPNASHWLHAEQPEIFLNHVRNFLTEKF
jgi:pimeloyl-ACP methyl ester carboxylesterase